MEGVLSLCLILTETACCQGSLCLQCSGLRKPLPHLGLFFRAVFCFLSQMHVEVSLSVVGLDPFPTNFFCLFFFAVLRDTLLIAMSNPLTAFGETCLSTQVSHTSGFYLLIFCFKFFFLYS